MREAMETPQMTTPRATTPKDAGTQRPYLPLRSTSLRATRNTPKPLWTLSQRQLRGFNPQPVQAPPHVDNVTASNEHAFAGRDENRRRPFKPPLGVGHIPNGHDLRPPSLPMLSPPSSAHSDDKDKQLRGSKSVGQGLRSWKNRFSSPGKTSSGMTATESSQPLASPATARDTRLSSPRSAVPSSRSAVTSGSSFLHSSSIYTERSSVTADSSRTSDVVQLCPESSGAHESGGEQVDTTVEDTIEMYAGGFDSSAKPSMEGDERRSYLHMKSDANIQRRRSSRRNNGTLRSPRPTSQPAETPEQKKRPLLDHRRSQSASLLDRVQKAGGIEQAFKGLSRSEKTDALRKKTSDPIAQSQQSHSSFEAPAAIVHRDRYGFKKTSQYITLSEYEAWDMGYSLHLERRRKKWHALMSSYGLMTAKPYRFPPKSDKIKRYVRKGIPADLRGAAWFWYAGGPSKLAQQQGLYFELLQKVKNGALSDNDREHIERDLNRTFPDNNRFKPDPTTTLDAQSGAGGTSNNSNSSSGLAPIPLNIPSDTETPILRSLRRVLQCFAIHNPQIGYCQSLNFIAGLLLLFLDLHEEKAFILLTIVTTTHLPGTHGIALEGANIDIAVLMSLIRDSLPSVWTRLDDQGGAETAPGIPRLPTISLATTAWFMSLFVGTLPIEAVLRVWDCLFFEGSKTLFRVALALFRHMAERNVFSAAVGGDSMEIFQAVQTVPRGLLDVNALMEGCFRRGGGTWVSQEVVERRRVERRALVKDGIGAGQNANGEAKASWRRWKGRGRS